MNKRDVRDRMAAQNGELLTLAEAARILHIEPQTARKQLTRGAFPVPTCHVTGSSRHYVRLEDLIEFVETIGGGVGKRKPGRPRKVEPGAVRNPLREEEIQALRDMLRAVRQAAAKRQKAIQDMEQRENGLIARLHRPKS